MEKNENKIEQTVFDGEFSVLKKITEGIEKYYIKFFSVTEVIEIEIDVDTYTLYKNAFSKPLKKIKNDKARNLDKGYSGHMEIYNVAQKSTFEDEMVIKMELKEVIYIAKSCTEKQYRRFELYYIKGYTFEQIAKLENCSERAVKKSLDRVLDKIQENSTRI